MNALQQLRAELDAIDHQIVALLDQRMRLTDRVAEWKQIHHYSIEDHDRENQVLAHVKSEVAHPILIEKIEELYALIMHCSKLSQRLHHEKICPFSKIGIIGMGLIGGSIVKTIKAKNSQIECAALIFDSCDLEQARSSQLIDHWHQSLETLCTSVDLLILAVPPTAIHIYVEAISACQTSARSSKQLIVCDVAGAKETIVRVFEKLSRPALEFLGTHPMSGKEQSGFSHSSPSLFASAPWIVTPHSKNSVSSLQRVQMFLAFLGADPIVLDPATHDTYAALISHLPGLISEMLLQFVQQVEPNSLQIAGPGFRSMTRLAHDHPVLRREVILENSRQMTHYFHEWINFQQYTPLQ